MEEFLEVLASFECANVADKLVKHLTRNVKVHLEAAKILDANSRTWPFMPEKKFTDQPKTIRANLLPYFL